MKSLIKAVLVLLFTRPPLHTYRPRPLTVDEILAPWRRPR